MIPFEPIDSADSRYGQLHRPICESPFKEAGIHGFTPPTPFKVAAHFLTSGDFRDFHWPILAKLNDEIAPFPWADKAERLRVLSGDDVDAEPILYNGPPPSLVPHSPPLIPHLSTLVAGIIASSDKLLFVLHSLGNQSTREWHLIRVAFADSVPMSPSCFQDGRFLVNSTLYITMTFALIQQINGIGYNIIYLAISLLLLHLPRHTSFGHLTPPRLTP